MFWFSLQWIVPEMKTEQRLLPAGISRQRVVFPQTVNQDIRMYFDNLCDLENPSIILGCCFVNALQIFTTTTTASALEW